MSAIARWLRCTEGQAYTALVGFAVALALAVGGVPAVLRAHSSDHRSTSVSVTTGVSR